MNDRTDLYATKPPSWWKKRNATIVNAARRGVPQHTLATRYGISRARVGQLLERAGVSQKQRKPMQIAEALVQLHAAVGDINITSWSAASRACERSGSWAYHFLTRHDPALLASGTALFEERRAQGAAAHQRAARARILTALKQWRRTHTGTHPAPAQMLSAAKHRLPRALAWSNIYKYFGSIDALLRAADGGRE